MSNKDPEDTQETPVYIHENLWTAQMVGKDFFFHHDTIHILYDVNPMERVDFTLSDTF